MQIAGRESPGRGTSQCKGPEVGGCLVYSSKEARVAGKESEGPKNKRGSRTAQSLEGPCKNVVFLFNFAWKGIIGRFGTEVCHDLTFLFKRLFWLPC